MKKHIFLILTIFSFLFVSCSNLFESSLDEGSNSTTRTNTAVSYVTVTGSMLLDGAFPEEVVSTGSSAGYSGSSAGRTAFPETPGITNYDLYITATNTTDSTDTITNTILAADNTDGTYTIGIPVADTQKSYTIEVVAKEAGDTTEILKGESESFPISTEEPVVNKNITLHAISDEGHGYIDLDIDITGTGENINAGVLQLPEIECEIDDYLTYNPVLGDRRTISFKDNFASIDEIPSGSYKAKFIFYKDFSGTTEIYSFYQTVNVYSGLTTNTWVKNGSEPYLVDSDDSSTVCKITQELLTDYELTNIYVNSNLTTDPEDNSKPYTANTGTFLNPLVSFQAAIDKISNPSKDYTIHVKGSFQGCFELPDSLDSKMNSLTIVGESPLVNGEPQDKLYGYRDELGDLYDAYDFVGLTTTENGETIVVRPPSDLYTSLHNENKDLGVLNIKTQKNVTLKNIEISNGFRSTGGGLFINGGSVTINDGVIIKNNLSWKGGGGIAVSGNGTLVITGGKITNNCCYYSELNSMGGGISVRGNSKFILSGGEISYNKSSDSGGGVAYLGDGTADSIFIMTGGEICHNRTECVNSYGTVCGYGGGLSFSDGNFTMSGGSIHNNFAKSNYGGLFVNGGNLSITGGEIRDNTSEGQYKGIYIWARDTTLKLGGNAYIPAGEHGDHSIYLEHSYSGGTNYDAKITLCDALTNHSESDPIYIVPGNYTRGNTVVQADNINISNLSSYTKHFVLADPDANLRTPSGDRSKLVIDLPIFVKQGGFTADAENAGTRARPVASIEIACSPTLMNNRDIDYTIAIDGILRDKQIIPNEISNSAKSITITGANGYYPATDTEHPGELKDAIDGRLTEGGTGCSFPVIHYSGAGEYVNEFSLILSDIKITGADNKASYGGGLHIENSKVYIEDGTLITGNNSWQGGGIYLRNATLYMSGGKISSNTISTTPAHNTTKFGAGIYGENCKIFMYGNATVGGVNATNPSYQESDEAAIAAGGNVGSAAIYLKGTVDEPCYLYLGYKSAQSNGNPDPSSKETLTGGIIGNYNDGSCDNGGGINIFDGKIFMDSGEIAYNCSRGGAGILAKYGTTIEMSGGEIHNNYAFRDVYDSGGGGGIQLKGTEAKPCDLTMTGGQICDNKTAYYGGGVYVTRFSTFKMSGGSISSNHATKDGGAIENSGKTFIYGSAIIGEKGTKITSATDDNNKPSNTSEFGAGIHSEGATYSTAILYLGYSEADENGAPTAYPGWSGGIYRNLATKAGGGIYNSSYSYIYMYEGEIQGNYADCSGTGTKGGAGLYQKNSSKFYMNGGVIKDNNNNTSSGIKGSGVYIEDGEFRIKGYACVLPADDGTNDFFIDKNKKIIPMDSLTPRSNGQSAGTPVPYTAQLTLHADNYNQGYQVITLDNSWSSETKKAICDKFYLADNDTTDNIVWSLDENGCLKSVSN